MYKYKYKKRNTQKLSTVWKRIKQFYTTKWKKQLIFLKKRDIMKAMNNAEYYENLINGEKREQFEAFRALLLEYNQKYNLTTITEEQDMRVKHFLDSGMGESLFKNGAKVVEIGSGAGFPSIVLKILRPDLCFDLLESVGKKCEFLQTAVDKLGLSKMYIYNLRAETAAKDKKFRECYDHATARAVARMNTLSEYCLPFVKVGGTFVAYKSGDQTEIKEAETAYKSLGAKLENVFFYSLPEGYGERTLVVVKKIKNTPPKYPRGQGKERKNPL